MPAFHLQTFQATWWTSLNMSEDPCYVMAGQVSLCDEGKGAGAVDGWSLCGEEGSHMTYNWPMASLAPPCEQNDRHMTEDLTFSQV